MVSTQEHWRIEKWANETGAIPAQIRRLKFDGEPAILTFTFGHAEAAEPDIQAIAWDTFFAHFDLLDLYVEFEESQPVFEIVQLDKPSAAYPVH